MPREQGERGEFVETIAPEDALDVFDAVDGPVILSADVADHFGVTRETARRKLRQLHDRGVLNRRKVSRRVIYWWASEEGFDADNLRGDPSTTLGDTDAEDAPQTAGAGDATEPAPGDRNAESGRTRDKSDGVDREKWRDRLAEEVAGSGDLADRRADGILRMYDHLRKEGAAEKEELLAVVDPDVVEYADRSSVWSNIVKRRDTLSALPGVEKTANGQNKPWRWEP